MSFFGWIKEKLFPAPVKGLQMYQRDLQKRQTFQKRPEQRNTSLLIANEQGEMLLAKVKAFQKDFLKNCNEYTFDIWKNKLEKELIQPMMRYAQALARVNEETNTKTFANEIMKLIQDLNTIDYAKDMKITISRHNGFLIVLQSQIKQLQKRLADLSATIVHQERSMKKAG